jgi:hypothetical protein
MTGYGYEAWNSILVIVSILPRPDLKPNLIGILEKAGKFQVQHIIECYDEVGI